MKRQSDPRSMTTIMNFVLFIVEGLPTKWMWTWFRHDDENPKKENLEETKGLTILIMGSNF